MKTRIRIGSILLVLALMLTVLSLPTAADSFSPAGRVTTKDTGLNIRKSPSASAGVVGKLTKDSSVTLLSKTGNWYQVQYGTSATGYCSADYITPITYSKVRYVAVTSGNLNVRRGTATSYPIATTLPKGTKVVQTETYGSWSRILYNGVSMGYVMSKYLSDTPAGSSTGTIALSVPRYLQTDSRWSRIKMGSSSATIGKSGCATTALAMVESYRLGQTITPATMVKRLSYTAGGSVYWPGNYSQTTNSSNYLTFIYNKLKAGKPVIVGLKNNAGGMHFVVVTGCKGSITSASSYTVNDPGTYSRTNLSQVLAVYPRFYKMLWVS